MRIHISEPCKALLTPQYKTEDRNEPDLSAKVVISISIEANEKKAYQVSTITYNIFRLVDFGATFSTVRMVENLFKVLL
jgi:hypothetical protein